MGSAKQISIGVVCLVAAFAFGNYVNTHPSGGHPTGTAQADSDSKNPAGNVQSRLTSGIELIQKQPASIATMRKPLKPRFSMPRTGSNPTADNDNELNALPPPSQLAKNESGSSAADELMPTGATQNVVKASDVPDFSSIMNELANTPISLQPLGEMPRHSTPNENRTAQAVAKPRANGANTSLKDLVTEFKMATQPRDNDKATPWNMERKPEFTADDFAPELQDRFTRDVAKAVDRPVADEMKKPQTPATVVDANQPGFAANQSNHVVSREPIPPLTLGQPPGRELPQRLARIETKNNTNPVINQDALIKSASPKIPFSLNAQARQQLVSIKSRASSQLALNTTRFVDHVVQPGETLQSISKRYFGDPDYYLDIYLANRNKLRNPVDIETGTALRIPIYK